jgi:hypothetical protein
MMGLGNCGANYMRGETKIKGEGKCVGEDIRCWV